MAAVEIYNIMRKTCILIFWGLCHGKHLQLTIFSHDNSSLIGLDGRYHFRLYQSFKKSPVQTCIKLFILKAKIKVFFTK